MAEKRKAYQRFEDLTRKATARPPDVEPDRRRPNGPDRSAGTESPPAGTLSIWLTPELRQGLEERAAADARTPAEIIQEAIRRYLDIPG